MPYAEKLKTIKAEKGLTNGEIAQLGDVPLSTVTRVFSEKTLNASFETITRIAIGMGISLDELVGLKQPDAPPIPSPIESTLNSYSELLAEKDIRINELKEEKDKLRTEKYRVTVILLVIITFILILLAVDVLNGDLGNLRY